MNPEELKAYILKVMEADPVAARKIYNFIMRRRYE